MKTEQTNRVTNLKKSKSTASENPAKKERPKINSLEDLRKYQKEHRSKDMLTVKDVIKYLKTQNPDACILGYESNSRAYIEQFKDIPNMYIRTVREDKIRQREQLENWYRHDSPEEREKRVKADLDELYRYAEDDDVIFSIGN